MRKWKKDEAVKWLEDTSDVGFVGQYIFIGKNGLSGLKACSAFDYLVNHCGYISPSRKR